jgi:predicted dehydrogenase
MFNLRVLVIGGGSIGERHIRVLQDLGIPKVGLLRNRNLPLRNTDQSLLRIFFSWEDALNDGFDCAIICTPTHLHKDQFFRAAKAGLHVLIEKPLCHIALTEVELNDLFNVGPLHFQVAYMLRYHPVFQKIKRTIQNNEFGPLYHSSSYWGEYLPDWHPWEDYRISYAAKQDMGGGAALTLSHDLELMFWLHESQPVNAFLKKQFYTPLDVSTDSAANAVLEFPSGGHSNIHVNFLERNSTRSYRFVFERASLQYDYFSQVLYLQEPGKECVQMHFQDFNRNDMFIEQAKFFLSNCEGPNIERSLSNINLANTIVKLCQ